MSRNPAKNRPLVLQSSTPLPYVLPDQVEEEAKIMSIEFYKSTVPKFIFFVLCIVLTGGSAALLSKWIKSFYVLIRYVKGSKENCDYVAIQCIDGTTDYVNVNKRTFCLDGTRRTYKSFTYRLYTYYYDQISGQFMPIQFTINDKTFAMIHKEMENGIQNDQIYQERLLNYGKNSTAVPEKSSLEIILCEVLSPFYLFQLFAIGFWGYLDYQMYAGFILGISIITITLEFLKIKKNYKKIRQGAIYETDITVFRSENNNQPIVTNSNWLVPGDLIEIPVEKSMPCDVLLLNGTCVMNESLLTGESIPVIKQQLPKTDKPFDLATADQYILYSGTECLEIRRSRPGARVLGVVIRTGFATTKGRLVRSLLYSKPENFKLYRDAVKYLGAMACIAVICFAISVKMYADQGKGLRYIILESLDIITIAVPPTLPTVIAIGYALASVRLEKQGILTKSEQKIIIAGKVKIMCFDKTGTLTKDSLDLHSVRSITHYVPQFKPAIVYNFHNALNATGNKKGLSHHMLELMATCHSLTYVKGKISGNPLDIKMFETTGWIYDDYIPNQDGTKLIRLTPPTNAGALGYYTTKSEVAIVKRFEFSPELQRMSVIVRDIMEGRERLYVKGSPEMICSLCKAETVPKDCESVLKKYTQSGLRVIACATRCLDKDIKPNDELDRKCYEKELEFLGFLVFENKMKLETPCVIRSLKNADIRTIMLTGDNPLTAVFTARESGIIENNQTVVLGTLDNSEGTDNARYIKWEHIETIEAQNPKRQLEIEIGDKTSTPTEREYTLKKERLSLTYGSIPQRELIQYLEINKDIVIAMTGDAFNFFDSSPDTSPALRDLVLQKCSIFSRMLPDSKASIIDRLQKQGHIVGMCGDGANDCPALKIANVGVSLSGIEASLAAPFVSKVPNISSVDTVLREGRASLATCYQCFKFISIYALIQAFSAVILTSRGSMMTDPCYLYQDFVIKTPVVFTISLTPPTERLSNKEPPGALMRFPVLFGMIGQSIIQAAGQYIAIVVLQGQRWYESPLTLQEAKIKESGDEEAIIPDYDNAVVFLVGNMQYLTTLMAFYMGKPFRQPFYKNIPFTISVVLTFILSIVLILAPMEKLYDSFEIKHLESQEFRWILLGVVMGNGAVTILFEKFIAPWMSGKVMKLLGKKMGKKTDKYEIK